MPSGKRGNGNRRGGGAHGRRSKAAAAALLQESPHAHLCDGDDDGRPRLLFTPRADKIQADLETLTAKIVEVERKQKQLISQGAPPSGGGPSPHSLNKHAKDRLSHLWKKEEQLREGERLLREEKLLVLPVELANSQPFRLSDKPGSGGCAGSASPIPTAKSQSQLPDVESTDRSVSEDGPDSDYGSDSEGSTVSVSVILMPGKTIRFDGVPADTTIEGLLNMIKAKEGIPEDMLRLFCDGKATGNDVIIGDICVGGACFLRAVSRLRGGKPVILLYPPAVLEASVRLGLSSDWSFSVLYPKPSRKGPWSSPSVCDRHCEWKVRARPDGSLLDLETSKEYPYLFWEADSEDGRVARSFELGGTPSFCVAGDRTGVFLDEALMRLGLNARERCDMITYWLLQLETCPFNAIYFVDVQRYAKAAKLDIVPTPDVVIRVFMAFRGMKTYDAQLDTAEMNNLHAPAREGFVTVEWGGMNLNGHV